MSSGVNSAGESDSIPTLGVMPGLAQGIHEFETRGRVGEAEP